MEDATDIVKELGDATAAANALMARKGTESPITEPVAQLRRLEGFDAREQPRGYKRPGDVAGVQYALPYGDARVAGWKIAGIRPRGRSGQFVEVREFQKGVTDS